jgi:hypothetical protein
MAIRCSCGKACSGARQGLVPECEFEGVQNEAPATTNSFVFNTLMSLGRPDNVVFLIYRCPACHCKTYFRAELSELPKSATCRGA